MDALERISDRILVLRGVRVILDADLALLYGVETRRLNEQVKRNRGRFPPEFMFRMTNHELAALMSQIATSKRGRGSTRDRGVGLRGTRVRADARGARGS